VLKKEIVVVLKDRIINAVEEEIIVLVE